MVAPGMGQSTVHVWCEQVALLGTVTSVVLAGHSAPLNLGHLPASRRSPEQAFPSTHRPLSSQGSDPMVLCTPESQGVIQHSQPHPEHVCPGESSKGTITAAWGEQPGEPSSYGKQHGCTSLSYRKAPFFFIYFTQ
jgi:hypothetical protein